MQPSHITKVLLDVGTEKAAVRMESSFLKWKMCSKIDYGDGYTYLDIQHQVWTVHSKWVNCGACELCLNDVFLFRWQYNPVWARKVRKLWPHAKAKLTGWNSFLFSSYHTHILNQQDRARVTSEWLAISLIWERKTQLSPISKTSVSINL